MSSEFSAFDDTENGVFATIGKNGAGAKYADMNKGITPLFFIEELPDEAATERAGTLKVREQENVRLIIAGDMLSAAVHPVTREIKERFADQYRRWKETRSNDHIDGTPLDAWPLASRGFIMELKAVNVRSVEDLAGVADSNIQRITDGRIWRAKAQAWLATNKDAGQAAKYAADFERANVEIADLKRQLAEVATRLSAMEGSSDSPQPHRGPGRPRKAA
jgi:hypothetical protein